MATKLKSHKQTEEAFRAVTLISDSVTPCGVEAFARRLAGRLGARSTTGVLGRGPSAGEPAVDTPSTLVVNLPIVAWKRRVAGPVMAAARWRSSGQSVVVVLHEWCDLDWKRRCSYVPSLILADVVMFSCPLVARSFGASMASAVTTRTRGVLPIPPNVSLPTVLRNGRFSERVERERDPGRVILGHFGSIYPRKRSTLVLDVAAEMKARGERPFVVFAGSFIQGQDSVEREFFAHVRRLGLDDDVLVTGFIAEEDELFGLLTRVDVFLYSFAEGLSTRRASVFACLTANKPVVVNAPGDMSDFDHHATYRSQLASGLLRLVPLEADAAEMADAVAAARHMVPASAPLGAEAAWTDVARAFLDIVSGRAAVAAPRGHAASPVRSQAFPPPIGAVAPDAGDRPVHPLGA